MLITSNGYYLELDDLSLYRWDKAKVGHMQFLRRDLIESKMPWLVIQLIKPFKWLWNAFNHVLRLRKGIVDAYVFERLFNGHIQRFGQPDTQKDYLACKMRLTKLRYQRIITGNRFLENQIAIEQINLQNLDPANKQGMDTDECLSVLAKFQGVAVIHKKDITVVEFENLMKSYGRESSRKK
jgi:hypothetical protein